MPTYKLTYFDFTGAAEPVRYIFAYVGQPYEDIRVSFKDWPALKTQTPFGKLPTLQIDDKVVCQSNAIARYLAKQFDLLGKDDWETFQGDILVDVLGDLKQSNARTFFEEDPKKKQELKKEVAETVIPYYYEKLEKIAKENGNGLMVGSKITWADLTIAENLKTIELFYPGSLKTYPNLTAFVDKIHSIPSIKAWIEKRPVVEIPNA